MSMSTCYCITTDQVLVAEATLQTVSCDIFQEVWPGLERLVTEITGIADDVLANRGTKTDQVLMLQF